MLHNIFELGACFNISFLRIKDLQFETKIISVSKFMYELQTKDVVKGQSWWCYPGVGLKTTLIVKLWRCHHRTSSDPLGLVGGCCLFCFGEKGVDRCSGSALANNNWAWKASFSNYRPLIGYEMDAHTHCSLKTTKDCELVRSWWRRGGCASVGWRRLLAPTNPAI